MRGRASGLVNRCVTDRCPAEHRETKRARGSIMAATLLVQAPTTSHYSHFGAPELNLHPTHFDR